MRPIAVAAIAALAFCGPALAQPPATDFSSLTWLAGSRAHKNPDGSLLYEAFIGPTKGVVTGTALNGSGATVYTEFHRFGPNAEGKLGLSVMNSRTNAWAFTPLQSIEKGRVIFGSTDGNLHIVYWDKGHGAVGAMVERNTNGQTTKQEWSFEPLPAPK